MANSIFHRWQALKITALVLGLAINAGCQKAAIEEEVVDATEVNVGVVDEEGGMYMRLIPNEKVETYMHESSSFTSECAVKESSTDQDIGCIVEAAEEDLHFFGYEFQLNVPSSMCDYAVFDPYYYYSRAPGYGPSFLSYEVDATGTASNITYVDGVGTVTTPATIPNPTCAYDYTESDGPNCCLGKLTTVITSPEGAQTSEKDWGGSAGACLAGPAIDTQTLSNAGFPARDVYFVEGTGLNISYKVDSPLGKGKNSNIHAANFFASSDHGGGSLLPQAMRAQTQGAVTVSRATQPYFELICMDRAFEVRARIRTQVREWNEYSEFTAQGDPDSGEPADTEDDFGDQYLNDRSDWRNIANGYPGE